MKKTVFLVLLTFFSAGTALAQSIPSQSPWIVRNGAIEQLIVNYPIRFTGLTPSGCLQLTSLNIATTTGSPCGSGGGGGSGNVATSTNEVANQVAVFSTNSATPAKIAGYAAFTWSPSLGAFNITGNASTTGAVESGGTGGVETYSMGSGVGTIGFNSFGYIAGVNGYGALMQLAPSTGSFTMFLESNVSAGVGHAHTQTLGWDNTGVVTINQGVLILASSTINGNATTTGTFFATNASSTKLFGAMLGTCNGANQALTWSAGTFGCVTISASGSGISDPFTHPAAGQSATTSLMLLNGQASSTQLSAYKGYFGGTATSTVDSAGVFTFITAPIFTNLTGIIQAKGASAATAITDSSTVGQVLRVTGASTYAWGALDLANSSAVTGRLAFGNLTQVNANSVLANNTSATADARSVATSTLYGVCTGGQVIGWSNVAGGLTCIATSTPSGGASFGQTWELGTDAFSVTALSPTTSVPIYIKGTTASSTFLGGIESWKLIAAPYFNATSTATSTFLGGINLSGTDCFATQGTCLQTFIQNATAYKQAVNYATAAILPGTPTYSNGSSGVGATLTEIGLGALTIDGQAVSVGQRILVKNQADQTTNGIYVVTNAGSAIANYILTRSTDYNTSLDIYAGTTAPVLAGGTVNGDTQWTQSTTGTIVVGTSNIVFIETSLGTAADTFAYLFSTTPLWGQTTNATTSLMQFFTGLVSASTTEGTLNVGTLTATSSAYLALQTGSVGIASTTPWALLSIQPNGITGPAFAIGSSTQTIWQTTNGGQSRSCETVFGNTANGAQFASSTSMTVNFANTCNQVLFQIGTAATTITVTGITGGDTKRLIVQNPGSTAGALTISGVYWIGGTTPTQTTAAGGGDVYSCVATQASSTSATSVKAECAQSAGIQ